MRFHFLLAFLLAGIWAAHPATTGQKTVRYFDSLAQLLARPTAGTAEQVAIIKSVAALEDQDGFALFFRPLVTTAADDVTIFAPTGGGPGRWFKITGMGGVAAGGGILDVVVENVAGDSNYLTAEVVGTTLTLTNLYFNEGSGGVTDLALVNTSGASNYLSGGIDGILLSLTNLYFNGGGAATNIDLVIVNESGASNYLSGGTSGTTLSLTNLYFNGGTTTNTVAISVGFDGAGVELIDDSKLDITIPFDCTITAVTLLADQSGSVVIDVWKDTYANYPPTAGDKITASAPPTITTAVKSTDSVLTGWTTSIAAGDTLRFNITSATTITRCTLSLTATRVQ